MQETIKETGRRDLRHRTRIALRRQASLVDYPSTSHYLLASLNGPMLAVD